MRALFNRLNGKRTAHENMFQGVVGTLCERTISPHPYRVDITTNLKITSLNVISRSGNHSDAGFVINSPKRSQREVGECKIDSRWW